MKKPSEPPATDDAALFRQAVEGAIPLSSSDRLPPPSPVRKFPEHTDIRQSSTATEPLSDHLSSDQPLTEYLRPGMDRMTLRKLRRGHWPIQDQLDLHGCTTDQARHLLDGFLQQASTRSLRCVNIVHGKGWRSEGGEGILKLRTRSWLSQHSSVLAFCEPPERSGGGGAVWVLLGLSPARHNQPY